MILTYEASGLHDTEKTTQNKVYSFLEKYSVDRGNVYAFF